MQISFFCVGGWMGDGGPMLPLPTKLRLHEIKQNNYLYVPTKNGKIMTINKYCTPPSRIRLIPQCLSKLYEQYIWTKKVNKYIWIPFNNAPQLSR